MGIPREPRHVWTSTFQDVGGTPRWVCPGHAGEGPLSQERRRRDAGPVTTDSKDEAHSDVVQYVGTSLSNVTHGDGMVDHWICGWGRVFLRVLYTTTQGTLSP
jgi:hypothetical protein